jgi:hypothetical protein
MSYRFKLDQRGSADIILAAVAFIVIFAFVGWKALSSYASASTNTKTSTTLATVSYGLYQASNNLQYTIGASSLQKYAISYYGWGESLQTSQVLAAEKSGVEPFLELQTCTGGGCSPSTAVPLSSILNGTYNSYLNSFGSAIKATGKPVLLTFDHEMNGGTSKNCGWYPWNACYNNASTGVTPLQWIQAWNQVTTAVNSTAGGLACWVWAPNIEVGGSAVSSYWSNSGVTAKNVCKVGVDGYYASSNSTWANTIGPSYKDIESVTARKHPFILAETGVANTNSNALSQIDSLVSNARAAGRLPIMYFDKYQWTMSTAMRARFLKDIK